MEEIIIDGVNVAGCEYYEEEHQIPDNINGCYYIQHCYCGLQGDNYCICNKNHNCYFKQLKRLEQENEELKNRLQILDDETLTVEITVEEFETYKKLKQENEQLKESLKITSGLCKTLENAKANEHNRWFSRCCEINNECDTYRSALEEIRKQAKQTIIDYTEIAKNNEKLKALDLRNRMSEIQNIITEAIGE